MVNLENNFKKVCSFYVSEYHLVTMLIPYIKQKLEVKTEVATILEQNLTEYVENLMVNINFKPKMKEQIREIGWQVSNLYKYQDLEDYLNARKNKEIVLIISGKKEYIDIINNNINLYRSKNYKRGRKIKIINCYEVNQFNTNIKDILNNHDKVLNTSGEKEIAEVFEGYTKPSDNLNVANN